MDIKVPCSIDNEEIEAKLQLIVVRYAKDYLRNEVRECVKEETKGMISSMLSSMDFTEIVEKELKKCARKEVIACIEQMRDESADPRYLSSDRISLISAADLYDRLAAYIAYTKLMSNANFKETVLNNITKEVTEKILKDFNNMEAYKKTREIIRKCLDEDE